MPDLHGAFWPAVVALVVLVLAVVLGRRGRKAGGEPLTAGVVLGLFAGRPKAWQRFRELLNQPPPAAEADKLAAIQRAVNEIAAGKVPKTG